MVDISEKYKKLWSYWDVRVLILASLFIQIVLIFLGRLRKTSSSRWIRMAVWSCYLLADWVADFVLGKLSSSMDDSSSSSSTVSVLAFWAPFLLLHLGGPDTITAYSMEDNELWGRHLLGLGYELIVAFYVLIRSLPGNPLLSPTLLIFLVAIIKYAERSYSLYIASSEGFRSSIGSSAKKLPADISSTLSTAPAQDLKALNGTLGLYSACKPFFVDVIPRVEVYEVTGELVKEMTAKEVLRVASIELSYAYDEIYTKAVINHSRAGYILRVLCSVCIQLVFFLFLFTPKQGFEKIDIIITYVLLSASICLDAAAAAMLVFSDWMVVSLLNLQKPRNWGLLLAKRIVRIRSWFWRHERKYWSGEMPQLNLISNCLKNSEEAPKQRKMDMVVEKLSFAPEKKLYPSWTQGEFQTYTMRAQEPAKASHDLLEIIASYAQRRLKVPWTKFKDPAGLSAIRQLTTAPAWTVRSFAKLVDGLSVDQQVLVWHIATELCYHWNPESPHPLHPRPGADLEASGNGVKRRSPLEIMKACKCLSNYMMHMVLMRPEVMSTMGGASPLVFWHACYDMVQFIRSRKDVGLATGAVAEEEISRAMMETPIGWIRYPSLFQIARALAHLMLFNGEEERWGVVMAAWVDLLTLGAKNTRASAHVKQLSRGGELLTFIWLLTKHAGMADALDIGAYMTGGAIETAKQLLSLIKLHLESHL